MTDTINPTDDAPEEIVDDQIEDQVSDQGNDIESDEDDDQASQDDEEYEEIERGDKKYKVPKALKPELMMEADYRRKTQELADQRRAHEGEVTAFKGLAKEIDEASFEFKAVERRFADLQALTADEWRQVQLIDQRDGTNRYDQLQREFLTLPRTLEGLKTKLDAKSTEAVSKQRELLAKRAEEGQAILARDIPGWGPDYGAKLADFVGSKYGLSPEKHGEAFMDPALIKMADAARKWDEHTRKTAVQKRVESSAQPVPKARGGTAPKTGLHDNLSTEEWMKREREQQARKQGRPLPVRT